jgi:hypothetical protein
MDDRRQRLDVLFRMRPDAAHMRPIMEGWADDLIRYAQVKPGQRTAKFYPPVHDDKAFAVMLGDDPSEPAPSLGPTAFDPALLNDLALACSAAIVVAGHADPGLYASAAMIAIAGVSVILVETRPEHDLAWAKVFHDYKRPVLVQSPNSPREGAFGLRSFEELKRKLRP